MPRLRKKENAGLPKRWRFVHGAYYYQVPPGQESAWDGKKTFRLGGSLPEAYIEWGKRMDSPKDSKTIGALLDRYALEVIPTKAVTTRAQNNVAIRRVRATLGNLTLDELKPQQVYKYVDLREKKTAAAREIELLSHAFTKAIEWGYIDRHPFMGQVRLKGQKPRTRYIEDWEFVAFLSIQPKRRAGSVLAVQAYIWIKLLTGMRRGDLLRLTMSDLGQDGIYVKPGKTEGTTGKSMIIEWTAELRAAVDAAKAARPVQFSPFLFCNRLGEGYFDEETGRAGGWESMWRGFVDRVMEETEVTERFTEHDLRAKCASDATTLEHARQLLSHVDSAITARVYRRSTEMVKPLS